MSLSWPLLRLGFGSDSVDPRAMDDQRTFALVAGLIFAVVALFHLVRIFAEWNLIIGDWSVPKSVSWVAVIVAGGLALIGLRLSQSEE